MARDARARAQRAGTLIIAAAGNDSERPGSTVPVSHPANCPSAMAVAALLAQANPGARRSALRNPRTTRAQRLAISSADVGSGLVQAS